MDCQHCRWPHTYIFLYSSVLVADVPPEVETFIIKFQDQGSSVVFAAVLQDPSPGAYLICLCGEFTGSYADESFTFTISQGGSNRIYALVRHGHSYYCDGNWHHAVIVVGSNYNKVYIDGNKESPTYGAGDSSTGNYFLNPNNLDAMGIGRRFYPNSPYYFNGMIDEVRLWNRTLAHEEINASYNSKVNSLYHNFTGLSDGNYTYYAHAIDTAGNENTTETRTLTIDTTKPSISFDTPPTPANNTYQNENYAQVNVTVTDSSNTSSFINWNRTLIGYWSFEHYNTTHVFDNSTYSRNGSFNGGLTTADITTGKYGNAMDFNGSSDYVNVGDIDISETTLTLSFWMKPGETLDSSTGRRDIVSKRNAYWFLYDWQDGQLSWLIGSGATHLSYSTTFNQDTWYHIVGIRESNGNTRLYINGDEKATGTTQSAAADSSNYDLLFGNSDGFSYHYDGLIDEVQLWNRTLSSDEINATYNSSDYKLYHNFTNLNDGNYTYYSYAIDTQGNHDQTETRTLTIDTIKPTIAFDTPPTPADNESTSNTYANVSVSVSDTNNISSFIDWNQSLKGYWNFEHTNSTGMYDNSTNSNFGTFNGANFGESNITTGKYGNALEFDGTDDYIDCGNDASLQVSGNVTVEAWIKPASGSSTLWQRIVTAPAAFADNAYAITYQQAGTYSQCIIAGYGGTADANQTTYRTPIDGITPNVWTHVIMTYNGTMNIYLNGVKQTLTEITGNYVGLAGSNVWIGQRQNNQNAFEGTIDEVQIYNRALSWEEINASFCYY
ncbi:Concanavalin A-like lectin/glucanases superfamily, partial [Thermoplasmatales archaeon SCGC AB-539-N05]